jgi:hypothetical protein
METQTIKNAVENLIAHMRANLPLDMAVGCDCEGRCEVCPPKLLEFIDIEIAHWESRTQHNIYPTPEEFERLNKDCNKVYNILEKQGLLKKGV